MEKVKRVIIYDHKGYFTKKRIDFILSIFKESEIEIVVVEKGDLIDIEINLENGYSTVIFLNSKFTIIANGLKEIFKNATIVVAESVDTGDIDQYTNLLFINKYFLNNKHPEVIVDFILNGINRLKKNSNFLTEQL